MWWRRHLPYYALMMRTLRALRYCKCAWWTVLTTWVRTVYPCKLDKDGAYTLRWLAGSNKGSTDLKLLVHTWYQSQKLLGTSQVSKYEIAWILVRLPNLLYLHSRSLWSKSFYCGNSRLLHRAAQSIKLFKSNQRNSSQLWLIGDQTERNPLSLLLVDMWLMKLHQFTHIVDEKKFCKNLVHSKSDSI